MSIIFSLHLAPCCLNAQVGEKSLNRRYQNEIRDSLSQVVSLRQREMQRTAESVLAALPNNEKLYDESYIKVEAELIDTLYADNAWTEFDDSLTTSNLSFGIIGNYWTASHVNGTTGYSFHISPNDNTMQNTVTYSTGCSVRLVRDY